jgi:tRNA (mo5U34)-methyltransferase
MPPDPIREARKHLDRTRELAEKGWYHSFELPDGTLIDGVNPLDYLRQRYARFPIPADLRGKRVLDIGAWDGWFSFEAERRGASVTAVDYVEVEHFLDLRAKLSSKVDYRILEVYELPEAGLGKFDVIFFLGILYHLKHPLRALEIVCSLTTDIALIETFVTDGATWQEHADDIPTMEFYETNELANRYDNWAGLSVACLLAMCRTAGFARVELLHAERDEALVACYRKWEPPREPPAAAPPELVNVANNVGLGINFSTRKEQYVSCWFRSSRQTISRPDLRLEVDGFGVQPMAVDLLDNGLWQASFPFPPGLSAGWKPVRLRFADSHFGGTLRIAVDLPLRVNRVVCQGVRDGITWASDEITVTDAGYLICWLEGLTENCDRNNVRIFLGAKRLGIEWMGAPDPAGLTQINTLVPRGFPKGEHELHVECGGVRSAPRPVRVI